ncbi:MAG: biopolymer transporter ExbD [Gammaproteobacteria bacterium]|nr:biopolymer transporter ExbD [Gammaproteobacteria bacterium]
MRRSLKNRPDDDTKIDITPMLDVVFIMLIFFIVTASFIKESGAKVEKPTAETFEKKPKATILLAVNEKDEIWLDRRKLDPRAVKANLNRLRAENPEGEVILQADQESTAETVMKVIEALKDAGIAVPTIATESE